MNEISPLDEFSRLFRYWWLIAICMLLGGLAAYGFHLTNPPLFEAKATIVATIDLGTFPFKGVRVDLIQYNEDMALGNIEGVLRSASVTQSLFDAAQAEGISLDAATLDRDSTIERKLDIWEVRFRNPDPVIAQSVANLWMDIGYADMLIWQADGRIPPYVILESPTPAYLPDTPIAYQLNNLLLAGCMTGLILGLMVIGLISRRKSGRLNQ